MRVLKLVRPILLALWALAQQLIFLSSDIMHAQRQYEAKLYQYLLSEINQIEGIKYYGDIEIILAHSVLITDKNII